MRLATQDYAHLKIDSSEEYNQASDELEQGKWVAAGAMLRLPPEGEKC